MLPTLPVTRTWAAGTPLARGGGRRAAPAHKAPGDEDEADAEGENEEGEDFVEQEHPRAGGNQAPGCLTTRVGVVPPGPFPLEATDAEGMHSRNRCAMRS